jgi:hypothetical protein
MDLKLNLSILFGALSLISGFLFTKFWKKVDDNVVVGGFSIGYVIVFAGITAGTFSDAFYPDEKIIPIISIACTFVVLFITRMPIFDSIVPIISAIAGISIGWTISTGITTGQWSLLLIIISLLIIGSLLGYLHERRITKLSLT